MNKFVVTAATAALLAGTALSAAQTQDTQGTGAQEEIIKKPNAGSGTEAAPSKQKPSAQGEASGKAQTDGQSGSATGTAQGEVNPDGSTSGSAEGQAQTGETEADQMKKKRNQAGSETEQAPGQEEEQQTGQGEQQPSNETTGSININNEQRTEITQVFREVKSEPVDIDIEVNVGVEVPRTVTLRPLPPRVIEIVPAYRDYEYFVLADGRIIIVEPGTFKVVYVLVV